MSMRRRASPRHGTRTRSGRRNGSLVSAFPSLIDENFWARGVAKLLLKATNPGTGAEIFATLYQGGIKEVKTVSRVGSFYDPRTETSSWTMNGPLICLHYFRRLPGMQDVFIDFDDIGERATEADVLVATKDGTAPRSQLSGGWRGPLTYDVFMDMIESAGLQVRMTEEGKFTFDWLEDDPASETTFYKRHILGSYPQAGPEQLKRPNVCRLEYFAPQRGYEVAEIDLTDAPWARVQSEIGEPVYNEEGELIGYEGGVGEQELPIKLVFCPIPARHNGSRGASSTWRGRTSG